MGGQDVPGWVGLEQRVCDAAPFDAHEILPNHGQFAALIAGFGLAGFILLLDRGHEPVRGERKRGHTNGALLLGLCAIVGLTAGYMFSALSGDHCLNSQLTYNYPSALLVITALLLVSGISVAAASQPQLGATATALRAVLVLVAVLTCTRIAWDYEYADQVSRRYQHFLDEVEQIQATSRQPAPNVDAGAATTLDRQLGLYAESRWQGRETEWPGLLADDLFETEPPTTILMTLGVVAALALAVAVTVKRRMRPILARGFSPEDVAGDGGGLIEDIDARTKPARAEEAWRVAVSTATVLGGLIVVAMFSLLPSRELVHPPLVVWVVLFGVVTTVAALVVQPPLVGEQRSLFAETRRQIAQWLPVRSDPRDTPAQRSETEAE